MKDIIQALERLVKPTFEKLLFRPTTLYELLDVREPNFHLVVSDNTHLYQNLRCNSLLVEEKPNFSVISCQNFFKIRMTYESPLFKNTTCRHIAL